MSDRGKRIRLGLFVLAALTALGGLIVAFGGRPTFLTRRDKYVVQFDNAPNVAPGTPVRRAGVRIGQVAGVELVEPESPEDAAKVRVTVLVDRKYKIRRNDLPTIAQNLLTGDSTIDFVPDAEKKDSTVVPPNTDTPLAGRSPFDTRTAVNRVENLIPSAQQSLDQIRVSFQRFERVAPEVEQTLNELRALSRAARETVPELRRTNDSVRDLADGVRAAVPEVRRTNDEAQAAIRNWSRAGESANLLITTNQDKVTRAIDQFNRAMDQAIRTIEQINKTAEQVNLVLNDENRANVAATLKSTREATEKFNALTKTADDTLKDGDKAIKKFEAALDNVQATLENVRRATQPLADRGETIVKNVEQVTGELALAVKDVRCVVQSFSRGDGTVQRLLTDPSLFNNANDAAVMVTRIMPRIDRVLKDLEVFADKIARHPEILGARGAIRPDSGLKDSPFQPSVRPGVPPNYP